MPVFQFIWEIRSAHKRELYVFWLSQIRVPKTVRFKAFQPVLLLYQFDTIESTGFSVFAYGNLTDLYGKATPQIEVIYSLKFNENRCGLYMVPVEVGMALPPFFGLYDRNLLLLRCIKRW